MTDPLKNLDSLRHVMCAPVIIKKKENLAKKGRKIGEKRRKIGKNKNIKFSYGQELKCALEG